LNNWPVYYVSQNVRNMKTLRNLPHCQNSIASSAWRTEWVCRLKGNVRCRCVLTYV